MTDSALVAAWVEATATVVAVGAAIYAGFYAKRAFDIEVRRDAERDEDRRRVQAEKVSAWLGPLGVAAPRYFIRNASDAPVYGLGVDFRILGTEVSHWQRFEVLPPGELLEYPLPREIAKALPDLNRDRFPVYFKVTFSDAGGRLFSRSSDGVLVRYRHVGDPQAEAQAQADREDPHP